MANKYEWVINRLDCIPKVGDLTDYCVVAHWTCTGTDGTYTGSVYNTASFEVDPSKPDYTPYSELTEAQVVGWVQAALGPETVTATYTAIDTQIENQVNPPLVTPELPWTN
jgi:hypothetical protein